MIHGSGFGKIILFGEHFVVYGLPAIVASLEQSTTAAVTLTPGQPLRLIDQRPFAPGVRPAAEKERDYYAMAYNIIEHFGITHQLSITLGGTLVVTNGGIGASSAASVSIATALNNYFSLGVTTDQLYTVALHGEKAIHGNPSGVDVAAALYGDIMRFVTNMHHNKTHSVTPIKVAYNPLFFVIIDSGQQCMIKKVLGDVAQLHISQPKKIISLFETYNNISERALNALHELSTKDLGLLMLENQQLLDALTLSTPEIDMMIGQAINLGAYGAKLTGTGRGGLVLALAPDKEIQQRIVSFFTQQGKYVMATTLQSTTYKVPQRTNAKQGVLSESRYI